MGYDFSKMRGAADAVLKRGKEDIGLSVDIELLLAKVINALDDGVTRKELKDELFGYQERARGNYQRVIMAEGY